jgi:hypothetical protein
MSKTIKNAYKNLIILYLTLFYVFKLLVKVTKNTTNLHGCRKKT